MKVLWYVQCTEACDGDGVIAGVVLIYAAAAELIVIFTV